MHKKAWCTCKVVVLLIKTIVFFYVLDGFPSILHRAFSLTWPASMQIYCNKRNSFLIHKKSVELPQDLFGIPKHGSRFIVWDTNMAAVSLFWNTNMTFVTSCENALYLLSTITDKSLGNTFAFPGPFFNSHKPKPSPHPTNNFGRVYP